jgi:FtsZ-binding cell division protein ZapB
MPDPVMNNMAELFKASEAKVNKLEEMVALLTMKIDDLGSDVAQSLGKGKQNIETQSSTIGTNKF